MLLLFFVKSIMLQAVLIKGVALRIGTAIALPLCYCEWTQEEYSLNRLPL